MHRRIKLTNLFPTVGLAIFASSACGSGAVDDGDAGNRADAPSIQIDAAEPDAMVADCTGLTKPTGQARHISHIPAHEDFGFDSEGFLIGVSLQNGALVKTAYDSGPSITILPNVSESNFARGTRQLPNGDIVVANPDSSSVERVTLAGSRSTLAAANDPNGIVIGSEGMVYLTTGGGTVTRIDPATGNQVELHTAGSTFDGIALSPDEGTLYFNQEQGQVLQLSIDENGPVGTPSPLTQITIEFLLDGMTTDACGNLYIVEMAGKIWRYSVDGALEEWVSRDQLNPAPSLVPAVNFGSGVGGWKNTSLYIMDFEGGVYEIDIGVPGRPTANL